MGGTAHRPRASTKLHDLCGVRTVCGGGDGKLVVAPGYAVCGVGVAAALWAGAQLACGVFVDGTVFRARAGEGTQHLIDWVSTGGGDLPHTHYGDFGGGFLARFVGVVLGDDSVSVFPGAFVFNTAGDGGSVVGR